MLHGQPPSSKRSPAARGTGCGRDRADTAALYGLGSNERLIGPVLAPHRDHITLCSKGGMAAVGMAVRRVIDGHPKPCAKIATACAARATEVIDLYSLAPLGPRVDRGVCI